MDTQTADRLTELYLDYLDLGGGLMMLSGVVQDQSHDFSSGPACAAWWITPASTPRTS